MRCVCGGSPTDTEAIEPVAGHILLGLEHDDMNLRGKHAAQDHKATQADGDTHGRRLNLQRREKDEEETVISILLSPSGDICRRNICCVALNY